MRGKLFGGQYVVRLQRITPAGAGKTRFYRHYRKRRQDHPRRCGENLVVDNIVYLSCGSPPQVRGKHLQAGRDICKIRITPAGAGKTNADRHFLASSKDHPRRCGENGSVQRGFDQAAGSPPQVRGKHCGGKSAIPLDGITPAGAGKTPFFGQKLNTEQDHPRRCGENRTSPHQQRLLEGSPPQVRGKRPIWLYGEKE